MCAIKILHAASLSYVKDTSKALSHTYTVYLKTYTHQQYNEVSRIVAVYTFVMFTWPLFSIPLKYLLNRVSFKL